MSSAPKEGTARYYEILWNEERGQRKLAGLWMSERKHRSSLTHPVPFKNLVAELDVLARLLRSELPRQLVREIESSGLINKQRRWIQLRGENPEIRIILGRNAQMLIDRGWKADPAYAQIAWDCGIEANDFSSAKEQIRKAHAEYRATRMKLTADLPSEVK